MNLRDTTTPRRRLRSGIKHRIPTSNCVRNRPIKGIPTVCKIRNSTDSRIIGFICDADNVGSHGWIIKPSTFSLIFETSATGNPTFPKISDDSWACSTIVGTTNDRSTIVVVGSDIVVLLDER
jgi:hypothetical protein